MLRPEPVEGVVVDANLAWDEEAIARAISQAQEIEEWDPETAKQLMAQAQVAKQRLGESTDLRQPYDAMRTLSRMLIGYKGGVTDTCVRTMDYRRYFGLVRELDLYMEEKNKKQNSPSSNTVDAASALHDIPKPQEYDGEVIRLI